MSDRKNQHFVPQFYLRTFSVKATARMVSLYHMPSGRHVPAAPIRSQACEDNFYKEREVETALCDLEGRAARVIAEAINRGVLPKQFSEDHHVLLAFVRFQAARTPAAADEVIAATNASVRKLAAEFPDIHDR